MAVRTAVREVRELIKTDLADSAIEHNCIVTANVIVDTHLSTTTLTAAVLTEIEKYLATHFVALVVERGAMILDSMTGATSEYANIYSAGLGATRFGQVACMLDTTGTLQDALTSNKRAIFKAV